MKTFAAPTDGRCDADRSEKITLLITKMTAGDLLPLCFVKGKGFRKLMHYTEPEYTKRTTVMSQLKLSLMFANVCNLNNKRLKCCTL